MVDRFPLDTIVAEVRVEREIKRSRFIATLTPVDDEEAAGAVVDRIRGEFHGASHHCTAMVLGVEGGRHRSNDDGEPPGTAGAPMLAVLTGAELTDVVAVVAREFGGTLLGAGGLVRAYGGTLGAAVTAATRLGRRPVTRFLLQAPLADAGRLEHLLHTAADLHLGVGPGSYTAADASFEVTVDDAVGIAALRSRLAAAGMGWRELELGRGLQEVTGGGVPPRSGRGG